jgi:hypothetical protein
MLAGGGAEDAATAGGGVDEAETMGDSETRSPSASMDATEVTAVIELNTIADGTSAAGTAAWLPPTELAGTVVTEDESITSSAMRASISAAYSVLGV